jgi:hypothetical protein
MPIRIQKQSTDVPSLRSSPSKLKQCTMTIMDHKTMYSSCQDLKSAAELSVCFYNISYSAEIFLFIVPIGRVYLVGRHCMSDLRN